MTLEIVPIRQKEAMYYVDQYHRHHKAPRGSIYQLAVSDGVKIVGVAIIGRPVSRNLDNGLTLEITRLCTDGTKNACSKLYASAWKVAKGLGYKRLVTYILNSENGASLKASSWLEVGRAGGGTWDRKERPRVDQAPTQQKIRFEKNI